MTPDRIRECLQIIQQHGPLSQRGLAAMVGYDERQVRRWLSDEQYGTIPPEVAEWLEKVATFYQNEEMLRHTAVVNDFFARNPSPVKTSKKLA